MKSSMFLLLLAAAAVTLIARADAYACSSCQCLDASSTESCINGYCSMSRDTAVCMCNDGYQGTRCQDRVFRPRPLISNPCHPNPCLNSGLCNARNGMYFCSCSNGFVGRNCEY